MPRKSTNNEITETTSEVMQMNDTEMIAEAIQSEFEIDSELLSEEFNAPRVPRLPYGIVINDNPAGLFIPEKNLAKAGWIGTPELTELDLTGGQEKGILLAKARFIVLGAVEPYIRYKNEDSLKKQDVDPSLALTAIGWYNENKAVLDKSIMDAVSEHLIVFLDENNEFLHLRPIRIRFKNVALWSLKEALDEFYVAAELAFSKLFGIRASGKDDRWRSLCVFDCQFKAVKEGEGSNKSYCCKVDYTVPTVENLHTLFLGTKAKKNAVWELFDLNAPALLTAQMEEPTKSALPAADEEQPRINLLKPKA